MHFLKNKSITFKKHLLVLFLVLFFALSPAASPAKAWDAIPAAILNYTLTKMQKIIDGIQLGLAKQAAINALQAEVKYLVTGKSVITNFNAYMFSDPRNKANVYANDLISKSLNGRGSVTGYIAKGSEGFSANLSYQGQLAQGAKAALQDPACKNNFTANPSMIFSSSQSFRNFNLYLANTPWQYNDCILAQREQKLQQEQNIAQTQAIIGGGFKGVEKNGVTTMPASLVKDQVSKVQNLGMDVIAMAQNLPEIITSAVTMTINQAMISGIGSIQASVHREVTNVRNNARTQINAAVKTSGPGALYKR